LVRTGFFTGGDYSSGPSITTIKSPDIKMWLRRGRR
jgi:hypothetical protein